MTLRGADVVAASPLMNPNVAAARPLVDLCVDAKRVREPNGDRRTLVADSRFVLTERDGSVAIRGRSGAGKTTLLRMLAGLDADYDGEYRLDGILLPKSVRELVRIRQGTVGYVTQVPRLLTDRSVLDNVLLGLSHASHAVEEAGLLLERVGAPALSAQEGRKVVWWRGPARGIGPDPREEAADPACGRANGFAGRGDGACHIGPARRPAVRGRCASSLPRTATSSQRPAAARCGFGKNAWSQLRSSPRQASATSLLVVAQWAGWRTPYPCSLSATARMNSSVSIVTGSGRLVMRARSPVI